MSAPPPQPAPERWLRRLVGVTQFARRRITGDYYTDPFGFDPDLNSSVLMPAAWLLYRDWFRVWMRGLEHVPDTGPALVVANHSGVLPFDAVMLETGVFFEHPGHRNLRLLGADLVYEIPVLASMARKSGHVRANPDHAQRLLAAGELVGVFPEGFKGIGKPFSERYRLQRFGRGGFALTALRAGVPIIPCAIVGAEEIYPMIGNAKRTARLLRLPYFPVTPLFPWLGPIGAVPLPSNWIVEFCPPVATVPADGGATAGRPGARPLGEQVAELADTVRDIVQRKLNELLELRGPAFS
jgi:1-acyl-sn-glycerol-3-phosphate acyltransferase